MKTKLSILGRGNVAKSLNQALVAAGYKVVQMWHLGKEILPADVYFVCVPDNAIAEVVNLLPENAAWVHCAANFDEQIFPHKQKAIFYPFMTFSNGFDVDWKKIPITVDSTNIVFQQKMCQIASDISNFVNIYTRKQLEYLHLSAVFACNFTNFLWTVAEDILQQQNIDFEEVKPLIRQCLKKIETQSPKNSQTGPAVRNDVAVIEKQFLLTPEKYRKIYRLLTTEIIKSGNLIK
ncbi:MAG: DUF2520 domain-containing protein [Bacteroidales bacterium]|jgi:predicted short-subunit dehydrogenase-like oxidoreductase (DUF2520 family)|nr:DUF2520 domain-containing protein [Bacteroidales bacterium]